MAFKIGAFARGFAESAVADKREKENEVKDLLRNSFAQSLQEATELRKERRARREQLSEIGTQLKALNLSEAQVAGILANGPEGAKRQMDLLINTAAEYGKANKPFVIGDFVKGAEDSNLTIEEGINRIMGDLPTGSTEFELPSFARQKTLFGTGERFAREQIGRLEGAFGESYGALQAESRGEFTRGELPTVTIDYAKMGLPSPTADLQRKELELKIAKLEKDLNDDTKFDALSVGEQRSARRDFSSILEKVLGVKLSYDEESGRYITAEGQEEKALQALQLASQGMTMLNSLVPTTGYANSFATVESFLINTYGSTGTKAATSETADEVATQQPDLTALVASKIPSIKSANNPATEKARLVTELTKAPYNKSLADAEKIVNDALGGN
jgi:hypothetical protein